jgi:hypothetical protein
MKKSQRFDRFSLALIMVLIVVALAACTPAGGEEPAVEPGSSGQEGDGDARAQGSGLATIAPTASVVEPSAMPESNAPETETSVEKLEEDDVEAQERASDAFDDAVTPVVVDLSKVTPESSGVDDTPQEMPQPGIPNPSALASKRAAVNLADRLGIDVAEVEVVSIEQVEWPDSSLGCPRPGQNYLTVITPGFRMILEANGTNVEYHADTQGNTAQCAGGDDVQPGPIVR